MENKKTGFIDYLNELKKTKKGDENNKFLFFLNNMYILAEADPHNLPKKF